MLRRFHRPLASLLGLALLLSFAARTAHAQTTDPRVVGMWRAVNGAIFELKADGTGSNARGPFRYAVATGTLVFTSAGGTFMTTYNFDGDKLVVTAEGQSATFTRAEKGAKVRAGTTGTGRSVVINRVKLAEKQGKDWSVIIGE